MSPGSARRRVAVVGAGWAGLSAAVRLADEGWSVSLFEMARRPGGRARGVERRGQTWDNGQHIMIGAYRETLQLMRRLGVSPEQALWRSPLVLRYPDGRGLSLPAGRAWWAFGAGVLAARGWPIADRLALLAQACGWLLRGFKAPPGQTVAELCARLPATVRQTLIEPLCVAALNTPAEQACAQVWLRVLRDSLFGAPGSADLLLPRRSLDELLPQPAQALLSEAGAECFVQHRCARLVATDEGWQVDGRAFDAVVLACGAQESARLLQAVDPAWAQCARALHHEPIVTVWLHAPQAELAEPMIALDTGEQQPAQFVFDHGRLLGQPGVLACVISAAGPWIDRGLEAAANATLRQIQRAFATQAWAARLTVRQVLADKRATFACTPDLRRPRVGIAPGLAAAGDHVEGPYPATLEAAVRSGRLAAEWLSRPRR